jgi:hypothetical protein
MENMMNVKHDEGYDVTEIHVWLDLIQIRVHRNQTRNNKQRDHCHVEHKEQLGLQNRALARNIISRNRATSANVFGCVGFVQAVLYAQHDNGHVAYYSVFDFDAPVFGSSPIRRVFRLHRNPHHVLHSSCFPLIESFQV